MSDEWGPWIEHDGAGFPTRFIGQYMQATLILACADEFGGFPGAERNHEFFASSNFMANPMWRHGEFGRTYHYTSGPFAGREFRAGKVVRYRIRKPRALQQLRDMIADLPAPAPAKEDAA